MQHWEGGCLNCGEVRHNYPKVRHDLFLVDVTGHKCKVGLCKNCFATRGSLVLDDLKAKLLASEKDFMARTDKEELNLVEKVEGFTFVSMEPSTFNPEVL